MDISCNVHISCNVLLYAETIFQILEFYVKEFKRYHHFYISVLPNARWMHQLTSPGCDVTGREL